MATKERFQNPTVGDQVNLRLFTYNSNNLADLDSIEKIEIYHLDESNVTADNPDGRRLVEEFEGTAVTAEDTGTYLLPLTLDENVYVIGSYYDIWTVQASESEPAHQICQRFEIYPDLWYSTPTPIVYDFNFRFQPNRFRHGSKQYIIVEISPNVPTAGDLRAYYENLAIVSDLRISIEYTCGECVPAEKDLRLVVDNALVEYREKRTGYYQLDTADLDCGLYDVWFQLDFGGNRYISSRSKFEIYD